MRFPNLIIAGAPKCGTTSLYNWLVAHPDVCGSLPKETYYFMDNNNPFLRPNGITRIDNYHDHGLSRYGKFFKGCTNEIKIVLEATPHYMYQQTALNCFSTNQPQPNIIFVLRNPSNRIFSHFCYAKYNLARLKSAFSFNKFIELLLSDESDKIMSQINGMYPELTFFWLKNQLRYSRYYEHLVQWVEKFKEDRINIILFEQMIKDPYSTVQHIMNRIKINTAFYDQFSFEKTNPTRGIKYLSIHRWYLKKLGRINTFFRYLSYIGLKIDYKNRYFRFQKQNGYPEKPDSISIQRLDDYFYNHNQKLTKAFNLNLNCWEC